MEGSIVCGVDGKETSASALEFALALSERLDSPLVLVTATTVPAIPGAAAVPHVYEDLEAAAIRSAEQMFDEIAVAYDLPPDLERRVKFGDPADCLVSFASEERAALLVVGRSQRGALASFVSSSTVASVIKRTPCPVAVVPEGAEADFSRGRLDDNVALDRHASPSYARRSGEES